MRPVTRMLSFAVLAAALAATGCKQPLSPVTATANATLKNTEDVPHATTLALDWVVGRPGPRVASVENAGLTYLNQAAISIRSPGVTDDAFYLQVFSHPASYISGDPPDRTVSRKGDTAFVDFHTGDLFVLGHEAPTMSSPAAASTPVLDPKRATVSAWLARVQPDDKAVAWTVPVSSPACHLITPGDCFDMSSVAGSLTAALASSARAAFDAPAGGSDPDPRVRTTGAVASLVSYIPSLTPALDAPGRRVRGVGLIFRIDLQVRATNSIGGSGVPTPWHEVAVYFPVAMLFESDGENGIRMTFDPFDLAGSPKAQMASHLEVEVTNPLGSPVDAAVGDEIATKVLSGFSAVLATPPASANVASALLSGFFTQVRGSGPVPADFDVVLLPERGANLDGAVSSPALIPAAALPGVQLVFLE